MRVWADGSKGRFEPGGGIVRTFMVLRRKGQSFTALYFRRILNRELILREYFQGELLLSRSVPIRRYDFQ
jgi:hypothetical protein